MVGLVEKRVDNHLAREKFVVSLGGEHSVSAGAVKAHAKKYKKISVLQLDAHSDLRDEYHDSKYISAAMQQASAFC